MEAVAEDASSSPPQSIEGSSHAHRDPLHSARERAAVVGFDDEMDMVRLQGKVIQAESEPIRSRVERTHNPRTNQTPSEARKSVAQTEGHVQWVASIVLLPFGVRNSRTGTRPFPTGSFPRPTPCTERELMLVCTSTTVAIHSDLLSLAWTEANDFRSPGISGLLESS